MEAFLSTETLIIGLLLIVSLVAMAVRRFRVPYTVALVVAGLLITFQSAADVNLTPELILALFVPPLVFEAAFHLNICRSSAQSAGPAVAGRAGRFAYNADRRRDFEPCRCRSASRQLSSSEP